jgi:hypothetical protein
MCRSTLLTTLRRVKVDIAEIANCRGLSHFLFLPYRIIARLGASRAAVPRAQGDHSGCSSRRARVTGRAWRGLCAALSSGLIFLGSGEVCTPLSRQVEQILSTVAHCARGDRSALADAGVVCEPKLRRNVGILSFVNGTLRLVLRMDFLQATISGHRSRPSRAATSPRLGGTAA